MTKRARGDSPEEERPRQIQAVEDAMGFASFQFQSQETSSNKLIFHPKAGDLISKMRLNVEEDDKTNISCLAISHVTMTASPQVTLLEESEDGKIVQEMFTGQEIQATLYIAEPKCYIAWSNDQLALELDYTSVVIHAISNEKFLYVQVACNGIENNGFDLVKQEEEEEEPVFEFQFYPGDGQVQELYDAFSRAVELHPDPEDEPYIPLDTTDLGAGWITAENMDSVDLETFLSPEGRQVLERLGNGQQEEAFEDADE